MNTLIFKQANQYHLVNEECEESLSRLYQTNKHCFLFHQSSNGTIGKLLYLKALIVPGLNTDVMAYKRNNPSFPNQSTSDQFFDEMQFDSYRELGLQLMMNVADPVRNKDIEAIFDFKNDFKELFK